MLFSCKISGYFGIFAGMIAKTLHAPFSLQVVSYKAQEVVQPYKNNYFELVYVIEGMGKQCVNKNKMPYKTGQLLLLTPNDCHALEIETPTTVQYVRFTGYYFTEYKNGGMFATWYKKMEYIFNNHNRAVGCLLKDAKDCQLARTLLAQLQEEDMGSLFYEDYVSHTLAMLLTILARNIARQKKIEVVRVEDKQRILDILQYIQVHIYEPEKLKISNLASFFSLSPTYFSEYFQKHTEETPKEYILKYKIQLVVDRLKYSDMPFAHIADELGFTDESHLNKIFKKYKGVAIGDFRKKMINILKTPA